MYLQRSDLKALEKFLVSFGEVGLLQANWYHSFREDCSGRVDLEVHFRAAGFLSKLRLLV